MIKHVVVLGGGFGGLWATRALASAPVRITLVDRTNHHLFQPLLYQVATAGLSAPDIAAPLRYILRKQRNVTVRLDTVQSIDTANRRVQCEHGELTYDYLVVATGASHSYFGHPEWAEFAPGLKTLDDAMLLRRRLLSAFEAAEREEDPERRAAWLNFAVVGAGPTGVELAGTLVEIARHTLVQEFRHADVRQAQVHLLEAGPRVLPSMPESLSKSALVQLKKLGVQVHLGQAVTAIDAQGFSLGDKRFASRTVLWAAGVAANPLGKALAAQCGASTDRAGRVQVEPDCSLPGLPEVFVIGDLASISHAGKPVPGVAPAAKQMGAHVAKMIRLSLKNKPGSAFAYQDFGNLATIGRMAAVVDLRGFKFSGLIAWWFWLFAHVMFLIGFRNRLLVLIQWGFSYWTYQRHARVIMGADAPPMTASESAKPSKS